MARLQELSPEKRMRMEGLLHEVGHGDFWTKTLFFQVIKILDVMDVHGVKQVDISVVLDAKESLISRYKKYHRYHPGEKRPRSGPKTSSMMFSPDRNLHRRQK